MSIPLLDRHADDILGVLSCYDRIIITGTLPRICYADGMTGVLFDLGVRIFDFPQFAKQYRDSLDANTQQLAEANGLKIEHISSLKAFRKEDRIAEIIRERGNHPGLVHIWLFRDFGGHFSM